MIFKTSYTPTQVLNQVLDTPGERMRLEVHDWLLNGKTVPLRKDGSMSREYSRKVGAIVHSLYDVLNNGTGCRWKEIPKAVRILEDERKREKASGIVTLYTISMELLLARKQCAPFDEFLKTYQEMN